MASAINRMTVEPAARTQAGTGLTQCSAGLPPALAGAAVSGGCATGLTPRGGVPCPDAGAALSGRCWAGLRSLVRVRRY
jgi:hypothetical protein